MSTLDISLRRLARTVANDLRLQYRHKFYHVYVVITVLYMVALRLIPAGVRPVVLSLLIYTDPAMLGFFFVAALVLFEKDARSLESLSVSPLRPLEYVLSKSVSLSVLSLLASLALAVGGGVGMINYALLIPAVFLTGMAYVFVGFMAAVRHSTLSGFLLQSVLLVMLLNIPVLGFIGVIDSPFFYLWPARPALTGIGAAFGLGSGGEVLFLTLLVAWNVLLARIAAGQYSRYVKGD